MPTTTTDKPHAGRVALVTGAAQGIGQAIAVGLAKQGATVVIGDIGDLGQTAEQIANAGSEAVTARLDISDPAVVAGVRDLVTDQFGRLDILVNNAAIFEGASWEDLDFELWQRIMAVNLNGPMLMCKAFVPLMKDSGWGRIINMASATVSVASPFSLAYRTSKMGVIGFTRALSATLGDAGVTVNVVLPSLTHTAMTEGLPEAVVNNSLGRQVIHRWAEPDDIAGGVLILAANEAGWITGQAILVNGGNSFGL
jgi:NAD(P)-dependent dehydrogenase (short-subunit alcohol dehydrogenase family)